VSKVVLYLRVSTDRQERKGSSLSSQERACRRYCEERGLEVVDVVRERVSGRKETMDRPGLLRVLENLDEGRADGMVVWALDRFARNVHSATDLIYRYFGEGRPFTLHATTDHIDTQTPAGRLTLNIKLAVAQHEAEKIAERIKLTKDHLRELGCYAGGAVPFGFRVGPRSSKNPGGRKYRMLKPDPTEQKVVALVHALHEQGMSLREVGRALEDRGVRSRSGRPFHPQQIKRILERKPALAG